MPLVFKNSISDNVPTNRTSFSGADIRAVIQRPPYRIANSSGEALLPGAGGLHHELGSLQTISIDSFRDKREVRSLGFKDVMGRTRGSRTVAGSLIFALLDTHPFNDTSVGDYTGGTNRSGILRGSSGGLDLVDTIVDPQYWPWTGVQEPFEQTNINVIRKHQYDFSWDSQIFGDLMDPEELPPFDIIITFVNEAGAVGRIVLYGVDIMRQSMTLSIEDLFTESLYQYTAKGMAQFEEGSYLGRLWNSPQTVYAGDGDYAMGHI
jgi:hypothetical protein